ncbi:phosphatidylethanolamine N-methyltransferase [Aspergillus tubingensis]|uniref:Uncharacterized protein n=1 Tax=Aspergillus tubingensis (strain CBS 134.48) TaxID=767770 RepID=A0A1L9MR10_ASPTC|nr:hypothetical protein ASPTUDRAFT_69466 [Aspergillus tubingensis CBS 134.48]
MDSISRRIEYMEGSAKPGNSSLPLPVPIPRQAIQNERRGGKKALTQVRHNKHTNADNADDNDIAYLSRTPQPSSLERLHIFPRENSERKVQYKGDGKVDR